MRLALLFFLALAACGTATPLPGGPPPEYEPSPIYSGSASTTAAPTTSPNSANSAATAIADAGVVLPILDHDGGA